MGNNQNLLNKFSQLPHTKLSSFNGTNFLTTEILLIDGKPKYHPVSFFRRILLEHKYTVNNNRFVKNFIIYSIGKTFYFSLPYGLFVVRIYIGISFESGVNFFQFLKEFLPNPSLCNSYQS